MKILIFILKIQTMHCMLTQQLAKNKMRMIHKNNNNNQIFSDNLNINQNKVQICFKLMTYNNNNHIILLK